MSKICKDFTYAGKTLSSFNFIMVDFDTSSTLPLAMKRDYIQGEKTKYRPIANHLGIKDAENLTFEIHIMRNPCSINSYNDYEISRDELRHLTKWLTSNNYPTWLEFDYEKPQLEKLKYCGLFNIEEEASGDVLHGLRLTFSNNSAYAYKTDVTNNIELRGGNITTTINNDSDILEGYCYPSLRLSSTTREEIFICNLSDATIRAEGAISLAGTNINTLNNLIDKVDEYALYNGYTSDYVHSGSTIQGIANNTAVQVYLKSRWGSTFKCIAFYNDTTGAYKIIEGGFLFLELKAHLPVTIDCLTHKIFDNLNRMVLFSELGVGDVDYMYWFRLLNGNNNIVCYGHHTDINIMRNEFRKVGAV